MSTLVQDIRYALCTCCGQPAFTIVAVLTLAVGIGANTAMFSVVNSTLVRPLPFREPDRLMKVSLTAPPIFGGNDRSDVVWSYPKYQTFCEIQNEFESTALYANRDYTLSGDYRAERVTAETVSASYFPLLGINAEIGRTFRGEEDVIPARDLVVLLGHSLWEQRFGRDPGITGKTIVLDTKPYTVVGVLPAGFKGLTSSAELWVPIMTLPTDELKERWSHSFLMVARLKSGVSAAQAKSATTVIGRQVDAAHPFPMGNGKWGAIARTMSEARIEQPIRQSVLVLFGAVGFVLLIACVNIANLLIARGTTRQREIAIRVAVGARPSRLIRQLLTESVLLSTLTAW